MRNNSTGAPAGPGGPQDLSDPFSSLNIGAYAAPSPARAPPPPPGAAAAAAQPDGARMLQGRPPEVLLPSQLAAGSPSVYRPPLSPSMQPLVPPPQRAPPPIPGAAAAPSPARPPPLPPSNPPPTPMTPQTPSGVPNRSLLMRLVTPQVIQMFKEADEDGDGKIGAADAKSFFKRTGLPHLVLARVWELSDISQAGELPVECFALALRCELLTPAPRRWQPAFSCQPGDPRRAETRRDARRHASRARSVPAGWSRSRSAARSSSQA